MAKKTLKNEGSTAEVRPAQGTPEAAPTSFEVATESADRDDNRLFELYLARVATIDRYRVPITDKGLPTAFRKALDEAKVALEVFNSTNER